MKKKNYGISRVLFNNPIELTLSKMFFLTAFFVFIMVIIGCLTRLTGSGLSMVDWRPITGFLPPLNQEAWQQVFELYKNTPEYIKINYGMTLEEFRSIFWLEYFHRLIGRLIGLFFLLPMLYAFLRMELKPWRLRVLLVFGLGLIQGFMGWFMVKSGLSDNPWVSPYRLCAHLLLAFLTFSVLFWYGLTLKFGFKKLPFFQGLPTARIRFLLITFLITVTYGAFVAGMKAGLIYNTFPFMGESIIPSELFYDSPWYKNFFTNPVTIQFIHRVLAMLTLAAAIWIPIQDFKQALSSTHKLWLKALMASILGQVLLGVLTLLYHVPLFLAVAHQGWALITLGILVRVIFEKAAEEESISSVLPSQSFNAGQRLAFDKL